MNLKALLLAPAVVLGVSAAAPARACDNCEAKHAKATATPAKHQPVATADVGAAKKAKTVEITVTSDGFVPAEVAVKHGQPVKLVVTRKVERTCATEIVMKDFGVNQPLPLNKAVTVTVTPKEAGEYRFACGMDMIAGVLKVD
ncbi:MAG TPA: cupredoxin domain-containing protein [Anaeromyxobacteraceae bacterium]|nr:cupredoxin domain-containing protein [Anaeromyxobacteraceae bacterium]